MQDHHKISLIVGAGAVAVLIYLLMQKSSAASNGSMIPDDAVAQPPVYPQNPVPQNDGGISIGGSPVNMVYNYNNPLPTLSVGGNTPGECGCDTNCETAGQKVTVQNVPTEVLQSAHDNLASYQAKIPPPKVSFTSVPGGAATVQPSSVGGTLAA